MDNLPEIEISWKRPSTIPFPNIWHRFETKSSNEVRHKVRIQDLTPDRYEEVMEFMMMHYFTEEPLSASSKLLQDEISLAVYQYLLQKIMDLNISIVAVLDDESPKPKIIGLQLLSVASKHDPPLPEVPGIAMQKIKMMYYYLRKNCDPFEILKTDKYLHEWGLCVAPEFRGLNVGFNILTSLAKISKTYGISASMIMFTRIHSQILAERAGFKMYNEIFYADYKDENGEVVFPVEGTKSLKYMGIIYI